VIAAALLAEVPALPLHTAGKYVAGAYIVLFVLVLVYVSIMAIRLSRIEGELGELLGMAASSPDGERARNGEEDAAARARLADGAQSLGGEPRESTPA
jgi:hypothetical protein